MGNRKELRDVNHSTNPTENESFHFEGQIAHVLCTELIEIQLIIGHKNQKGPMSPDSWKALWCGWVPTCIQLHEDVVRF